MARQIQRLSARTVASLIKSGGKTGRHADGNGLYLSISANGGRRWVFLYRRAGKLKEKGLGSALSVGLAQARHKAEQARRQIEQGADPINEGRKSSGAMTFSEAANAFIAANKSGWRNEKHRAQWTNTLRTYADPVIGGLPINRIDVGDVIKVVEPLWSTKTETASRVRGRIESVLDWAAARGYRGSENPARWRGHLEKLLPAPRKVAKVRHHPALPYSEMPAFMQNLSKRPGSGARALEFTILTAARTGETIGAAPAEFDLSNRVWIVPGERMKAGVEHRVPLSSRAIELLDGLQQSGDYVFRSEKPKKPLSNMAMLAVLKRMKRTDLTTHGFRSTFRDWAAETTDFPNEIVEMALAHTIGDKSEAAYRRGDMLERRRALMAAWEVYCLSPAPEGKLLPLTRSTTSKRA
jgi:integrase